jgi:hypothetical protein
MLTVRPDVVVLEHDHGTEVVSVRIDSADHHAVLFNEPEAYDQSDYPAESTHQA